MTEYVHVKPSTGGRIRMPDRNGTVMPVEGQLVPRIDYYERLILAGDLKITDAPAAAKEPEPKDEPGPAISGSAGHVDMTTEPRAQGLDRPNDTHKRNR